MNATKTDDRPKSLRLFLFLGMDLDWHGRSQAMGDCPFCSKEGKWSASVETGQWDCKVCGRSGNPITFLRTLWEESDKSTSSTDYDELARDRGLLFPETLSHWGVCKSILTGEWMVPGRSADGRLNQLYRRVMNPKTGKSVLLSCPDLPHQLSGMELFDLDKEVVYLCEGVWDAMTLWECLRLAKTSEVPNVLTFTGSDKNSFYAESNVLAVPGCNVFREAWRTLFADKRVIFVYDSDHPKQHPKTGIEVGLQGFKGTKKAVLSLCDGMRGPGGAFPKSVETVQWGPAGYDPNRPSGFDVRDLMKPHSDPKARVAKGLAPLLSLVTKVPESWLDEARDKAGRSTEDLECDECDRWEDVVNAWRKAFKWTYGLDVGLSVALAVVASTDCVGDQLWVKMIGPPSSGKSSICEALAVCRSRVFSVSVLTGFHSGWKTDKTGEEDHSLLAKVNGKTLVVKDGDTLLQAANKDKILSEARDIYDRTSRVHYGHGISRAYERINLTFLLCGTASLRVLDTSELGERFVDVVIVEDMDEELEDEIGWRVANRAVLEMGMKSDANLESRDGSVMVQAKRLTGGYVSWLRDNAVDKMPSVSFPDESLKKCQRLAEFVSFMRSRPSPKQEEKAEKECSFRLISQFVRLAKCLSVVLNKDSVDDEVMQRVTKVAFDTARGRTLELVRHLAKSGSSGSSVASLAVLTGQSEEKERTMLTHLKRINAVEVFVRRAKGGTMSRPKWRLTERMSKLWKEVTRA